MRQKSMIAQRTKRMPPVAPPFILGWEEWVALPDLGLPAIKAKVDTGARTSALHAFFVERVGTARKPRVRFGVHPIPRRADVAVVCTAPVVDQRNVTSSNGERESRYVIRTVIRIGQREWPIEVTLTNRDAMSYRMLLGRQAIGEGILVDPAASFRQPRLRYKLYDPGGR
jgi:ribosomal protein S6--L-glutamate ligase